MFADLCNRVVEVCKSIADFYNFAVKACKLFAEACKSIAEVCKSICDAVICAVETGK